jgi:hypothetical protein
MFGLKTVFRRSSSHEGFHGISRPSPGQRLLSGPALVRRRMEGAAFGSLLFAAGRPLVIVEVRGQPPLQMTSVQDNEVIQALPSYGFDQTFRLGILPSMAILDVNSADEALTVVYLSRKRS